MVPVIDVTKGPANGYKKVNRHSDGMISFHYQRRVAIRTTDSATPASVDGASSGES